MSSRSLVATCLVFFAAPVAVLACTGTDPVTSNVVDGGAGSCPLGCLPPAPAGWTGPSAVFDGDEAARPTACPDLYALHELDAHQLPAGSHACTCGAPTEGKDTACHVTLFAYGSTDCSGTPGTGQDLAGTLTSAGDCRAQTSNPAAQSVRLTAAKLGGTCAIDPVEASITPTTAAVSCGLPQVAACSGRPDCTAVPLPLPAPFSRLCIHHDGDVACPGTDYAERFVSFTAVADDRACSACTVTLAGTCGTSVAGFGGSMCSPPEVPLAAGACTKTPSKAVSIETTTLAPTDAHCVVSGGEATGTITGTGAVTFCCNK